MSFRDVAGDAAADDDPGRAVPDGGGDDEGAQGILRRGECRARRQAEVGRGGGEVR